MSDTNKQKILMHEIEAFLLSHDIKYVLEAESGDYLFYCISDKGNQFTFEICGEYVEFYSDKNHDTIMYFQEDYIHSTIQMINTYLGR